MGHQVITKNELDFIDDMIKVFEKYGWTKHVLARNHIGNTVSPSSDEACQFCILGAADRVFSSWQGRIDRMHSIEVDETFDNVLGVIRECVFNRGAYNSISDFNDAEWTTEKDILSILNEVMLSSKNLSKVK